MKTLFDPRETGGKKMVDAYPELRRIKEFSGLNDKKLKFIWYYASRFSPHIELEERERVQKALKSSGLKLEGIEEGKYSLCDFPEKERIAMDRMAKFNIETRTRLNDMVDNILNNYEKFSKTISVDNMEAYINASAKIVREIPNLLRLKEEGFAISGESESRGSNKGQEMISSFLTNADDDD